MDEKLSIFVDCRFTEEFECASKYIGWSGECVVINGPNYKQVCVRQPGNAIAAIAAIKCQGRVTSRSGVGLVERLRGQWQELKTC